MSVAAYSAAVASMRRRASSTLTIATQRNPANVGGPVKPGSTAAKAVATIWSTAIRTAPQPSYAGSALVRRARTPTPSSHIAKNTNAIANNTLRRSRNWAAPAVSRRFRAGARHAVASSDSAT